MNGKLGELLAKTLPPMGYELVDWEMSRGRMLRVFIDKLGKTNEVANEGPGAMINVDDCAKVSNHLTRTTPTDPTQIPGAITKQALTYQPSKIKKNEKL